MQYRFVSSIKKGLEEVSILHKNFCNMHIAHRNMHIAIDSILPLTYPYHPHNMKIVKHLTCVWHWCVSHLTCVSCLNYCTTMLWFCPRKVRTRNLGTNFQNLSQHKRNVIRTYPYKHPLHTPYDGYETPSVCFSLMWEPSWMGIASTTAQAQCCFLPLGW